MERVGALVTPWPGLWGALENAGGPSSTPGVLTGALGELWETLVPQNAREEAAGVDRMRG